MILPALLVMLGAADAPAGGAFREVASLHGGYELLFRETTAVLDVMPTRWLILEVSIGHDFIHSGSSFPTEDDGSISVRAGFTVSRRHGPVTARASILLGGRSARWYYFGSAAGISLAVGWDLTAWLLPGVGLGVHFLMGDSMIGTPAMIIGFELRASAGLSIAIPDS